MIGCPPSRRRTRGCSTSFARCALVDGGPGCAAIARTPRTIVRGHRWDDGRTGCTLRLARATGRRGSVHPSRSPSERASIILDDNLASRRSRCSAHRRGGLRRGGRHRHGTRSRSQRLGVRRANDTRRAPDRRQLRRDRMRQACHLPVAVRRYAVFGHPRRRSVGEPALARGRSSLQCVRATTSHATASVKT